MIVKVRLTRRLGKGAWTTKSTEEQIIQAEDPYDIADRIADSLKSWLAGGYTVKIRQIEEE